MSIPMIGYSHEEFARNAKIIQVDIDKNFELLNWKPKTSLDKGLLLTLCEVTDDSR